MELDVSRGDIKKLGYLDLKRLRAKNKSFFDEDSSMANDMINNMTEDNIIMQSCGEEQLQSSSYGRSNKPRLTKRLTKVQFP